MHDPRSCVERVPAGNGILPQAGIPAMIRWIDRETFDELILANTEASLNRMLDGAKPVLDTVRRFVPEADLFYRIYHDESERTNHVERVYPGFRRNGILFLVIKYTSPKVYYDLHCDWSSFRYADNYSYGMVFDKQSAPLIGLGFNSCNDSIIRVVTFFV